MPFKLTILGCGAATPTSIQNPTAQVLQMAERFFLIDCGEGTQVALRKNKVKFNKIDNIFISHLHGDHYFGLIGLLSSFHLLARKKPLTVHCPQNLRKLIEFQLRVSGTKLNYPLVFNEVKITEPLRIYEDKMVEVYSIPLNHSIATQGFYFVEKKKPRTLNGRVCNDYNIPVYLRNKIKEGADFTLENGEIIPNSELTLPSPPSHSYAFFSDTAYSDQYASFIKGVDLLYHESTFLNTESELAEKTKHSTAKDAAKMAKKASAKKLLLGHYSVRYENRSEFSKEAKTVFENVQLSSDGLVINVN